MNKKTQNQLSTNAYHVNAWDRVSEISILTAKLEHYQQVGYLV